MSHQQSEEAFQEINLKIDLDAMKGSPLDQESTPSNATDDDSQQSLTGQQNLQRFAGQRGFRNMSKSELDESGNEDNPDEEFSNIDLEAGTPKLSYSCEFCSKLFHKRSRLLSHLVTHSEQKDHICDVCGKGFKNKPQLVRHTNSHSDVPNFCCNICGRGFKHNDVAKHIRRWHSGPRKSNRGGVPNPNAPNTGQFTTHVRKKKRSQQSTRLSPQSLHQPTQMSLNEETHPQSIVQCQLSEPDANLENSSSFQCPYCNLSYSKQQELTCHLATHKKVAEEGQINQSKDGENKKHHQCHICNKTFTRAFGLTGHMYLHTRTEKRREPNPNLRCHICEKMFTRRAGLNAHILQHGGVLRFWCDETDCGKGFVHSYQLMRHKHSHSEVPPYSCEVCGKAFRHNDLAKHMRTHTGVKPYNCQHCGRAFTFNSSLRAHERMHLALKEHVCDICNHGFTTSAGLRRHAKCHEDEEEKPCAFCGELFSSKLHLNLHLQESPQCAEHSQQQQQEMTESRQAQTVPIDHQHHEGTTNSVQHLQHTHGQQVQPVQHLQVMPVPQQPHSPTANSMHELDPLHIPHHTETTTLANLSAASTEPVGLDSGPTSGQTLPVLVPFSVSVPISVPYGVNINSTAPDHLQVNHFLSWETKY